MNEVARAHRGHCVAPDDDGPLTVAFASAHDGFDAARELAGRLDARVANSHRTRRSPGWELRGESASEVARLLKRPNEDRS